MENCLKINSKEQSRDTDYNMHESIKYAREEGYIRQPTPCSPSVREVKARQIHRDRLVSATDRLARPKPVVKITALTTMVNC